MVGEVVQWPKNVPGQVVDIRPRIESIIAIFHAICVGELLSALPDCEVARTQHINGLRLLALAENELLRLHGDLY